jgi:hypothetical protein
MYGEFQQLFYPRLPFLLFWFLRHCNVLFGLCHYVMNLSEFMDFPYYCNLSAFQSFAGHPGGLIEGDTLQRWLMCNEFLTMYCNKCFLFLIDLAIDDSCIEHIVQVKKIIFFSLGVSVL